MGAWGGAFPKAGLQLCGQFLRSPLGPAENIPVLPLPSHHHHEAPAFLEVGEKWSPYAFDCLQTLARLG